MRLQRARVKSERTSDVWVCCCLERAESISDNEDADAETGEGVLDNGRNGEQRPESIQGQPPDEDGAVAKVSEDPCCVS